MRKVNLKSTLIIFFILLFSSAWADQQTLIDSAGRVVSVPLDPDQIVCLGPGALRLIVYLQAENKVCGIEDMEKMDSTGRPYLIAHPDLTNLPRCGPGGPAGINKKPDLEAILNTEPEVIFITYMDAQKADDVQETLSIPVVILTYGPFSTFDESVYQSLHIAGKILNREDRARKIQDYIEGSIKDLSQRVKGVRSEDRPRTYVGGLGHRGSHGIESTQKDYAPFDWIGLKNVVSQVKTLNGEHTFIDKEILLQLDPDVIFIDGGGLALIKNDFQRKSKFYKALKAFSHHQVYILHPFNLYTTNIGTALADAYAIGKILYPDKFKDINPEIKADEIYTFLVGKPVYQAMKKDYGPIGEKIHH